MNVDLEKPIRVNTFGFNVPSREFVVSAQITRDRRMPLVDEFILRALNVVESVPAARLSRFFGFEGTDLGIALADLQARSLVSIDGEQVSLHPSAKELFRTAADKSRPTVAEVEEFHARVWFDLVSQGMIAFKGMHNARNLLALKTGRSNLDFGADYAREAFEANFRDYLRKFRNVRNSDQWNLYAILDVQPARFSYAQLNGSEELSLLPVPRLEPVLWTDEVERTPRLRRLTEAMVQELQQITRPTSSQAAREEFGRLLDTDLVQRCMKNDGFFDLREWVRVSQGTPQGPRQPFIGHPYLDENRRMLSALLSQLPYRAKQTEFELLWLRPSGTSWGISEDLGDHLADVRSGLRQLSTPNADIAATLLSPPSVAAKIVSSFDRLFDRGAHVPPSKVPSGLEVLVVRDLCAVVAVLVPLSSDVHIPVGFMTVDPALVRRIDERAQLQQLLEAGTALWKKERTRGKSRRPPADAPESARSTQPTPAR